MDNSKTALVPPYNGNAGDSPKQPETITDILRQESSKQRADALKSAIAYIVHNAMSDDSERVDVRTAINIRHNISWKVCDQLLAEALPFAESEIAKVRQSEARIERERIKLESLIALFAVRGFRIRTRGDKFDLLDLTEAQIAHIADVLNKQVTP